AVINSGSTQSYTDTGTATTFGFPLPSSPYAFGLYLGAVNVSAGSLIDGRPDAYSTSPGVTLSGGRISVANLSPGNLTMSGGTLSAFGNVVVNGTLDWTGGTMGAGGTQVSSGQWVPEGTITASGQLIIGALDGAVHNEVLDGTTLTNNNNTSNSFLY